MELIDKSALAANIEARYNECLQRAKIIDAEYWNGKADAYRNMLVVLDTLEVQEVDLDWENVRELCVLSAVVELEKGRSLTDQEHYTEVIKRFKAQKGE